MRFVESHKNIAKIIKMLPTIFTVKIFFDIFYYYFETTLKKYHRIIFNNIICIFVNNLFLCDYKKQTQTCQHNKLIKNINFFLNVFIIAVNNKFCQFC